MNNASVARPAAIAGRFRARRLERALFTFPMRSPGLTPKATLMEVSSLVVLRSTQMPHLAADLAHSTAPEIDQLAAVCWKPNFRPLSVTTRQAPNHPQSGTDARSDGGVRTPAKLIARAESWAALDPLMRSIPANRAVIASDCRMGCPSESSHFTTPHRRDRGRLAGATRLAPHRTRENASLMRAGFQGAGGVG
jgi:hypothetical protein